MCSKKILQYLHLLNKYVCVIFYDGTVKNKNLKTENISWNTFNGRYTDGYRLKVWISSTC